MGDIAEMIFEGILCSECGAYIENSLGEFPQKCESCQYREFKNDSKKRQTMKNKIIAVIQARMGSSRFYGKVLKPLQGKSSIQHIVEKLQKIRQIDAIVVATTSEKEDVAIVELCYELGVLCFRGSETDVLNRVHDAVNALNTNEKTIVVDITADCPLVSINHIKHLIDKVKKGNDYASNVFFRSFPDGYDVQVYRNYLLKKMNDEVEFETFRSHVGWNIINYVKNTNDKDISVYNLYAPEWIHYPGWGLTLDTLEDYELLEIIFKEFYAANPFFEYEDVAKFLLENPKLLDINSSVQRKIAGEG